jgi:hypothetical protein
LLRYNEVTAIHKKFDPYYLNYLQEQGRRLEDKKAQKVALMKAAESENKVQLSVNSEVMAARYRDKIAEQRRNQNEAVGNEVPQVEPGTIEWIARDDNKAQW